jgi:hypothetical protein
MNIIEARKSGKPFKRRSHDEWADDICDNYEGMDLYLGNTEISRLYIEDILADDWEIKED